MACIKVALVEDNDSYLEEVSTFLTNTPSIEVVGKYRMGRDAIKNIPKLNPDIAIVDLKMPDITGFEIVTHISERSNTECIILTAYDGNEDLFLALKAGAVSYCVKTDTSLSALVIAIHETISGGSYMSSRIARRVIQAFKALSEEEKREMSKLKKLYKLTNAEAKVLEVLAEGNTPKRTAEILCISYETVRTHLRNIYQKLQVHSLVEATAAINKRFSFLIRWKHS